MLNVEYGEGGGGAIEKAEGCVGCIGCPYEGEDIGGEAQGFDVIDGAGLMVGVVDQFEFPAADQSTARPACCGNAEGFEEVGAIGRDGWRG